MVRTGAEGPKGISCLLVEKGTPGNKNGNPHKLFAHTATHVQFVVSGRALIKQASVTC